MNNRKFKSDKTALIAEGKHIASSSDDAKFLRKVTIVNLMLGGMKAKALAEACGKTDRTLSSWIKAVDEHGVESLRAIKQPGRAYKLSDAQKEEIKVVAASDPTDYGYNVWDAPTLSNYIESKYNISYGVRQSQRLLHALDFSLIRPQTFPSKGDEASPEREELKIPGNRGRSQ